jgi:hypothetical protein
VSKITVDNAGIWENRDCPAAYARETVSSGRDRLALSLPQSATDVFRRLAEMMSEPFLVLYILHTPRGEGEKGRYQSEEITKTDLDEFLTTYERFFAEDARHDIWIRSIASGDMIIWDRHNDIFIYGDLDRFERALDDVGFNQQSKQPLGAHQHHYRVEFDNAAAAILAEFRWRKTPLQTQDEQFIENNP